MSAEKQIHIIFGGASIGRYDPARFQTVERVEEVLGYLEHYGVDHIDTAQVCRAWPIVGLLVHSEC